MHRRQIAYLTSLWWEGDVAADEEERHVLALASALVEAGRGAWNVDVVGYAAAAQTREIAPGVRLHLLETARLGDPAEILSWELTEIAGAADLLHLHHPFSRTGDAALLLAKQQDKPVCVSTHGATVDALGVPLGSLGLVDAVFCSSAFLASFLQMQGSAHLAHRAATIVRGGVDSRSFTPAAAERDRFLFVGKLLPQQGVEHLIAALPAGARLTICGRTSPYHLDYVARLQAAAAGKNVDFIGAEGPEQMRTLYRRATACVLPAVLRDCYGRAYLGCEVSGWALLEAMACGTPVMAARVGGLPELIQHGQNGWLFDEPSELAACLERLTNAPGLVEECGRRARAAVEREFDVRGLATAFAAAYEALLVGDPLETVA